MLSIQMLRFGGANEKLTTICMLSRICHRHYTGSSVLHSDVKQVPFIKESTYLELEIFIFEFVSVDGFSSSTVSFGKIATLTHELWNHSMKL